MEVGTLAIIKRLYNGEWDLQQMLRKNLVESNITLAAEWIISILEEIVSSPFSHIILQIWLFSNQSKFYLFQKHFCYLNKLIKLYPHRYTIIPTYLNFSCTMWFSLFPIFTMAILFLLIKIFCFLSIFFRLFAIHSTPQRL